MKVNLLMDDLNPTEIYPRWGQLFTRGGEYIGCITEDICDVTNNLIWTTIIDNRVSKPFTSADEAILDVCYYLVEKSYN